MTSNLPLALPLSAVVYKWADERRISPTEVLREMQRHIYTGTDKSNEENFLAPAEDLTTGKILSVWPKAYFERSGEMSKQRLEAASQSVMHPGGRVGLAYGTDCFWKAWWFLKEPAPDLEPENMRQMLSEFMVKRDDFRKWICFHGYRLPRFWFDADIPSHTSITTKTRSDALAVEIDRILVQGTAKKAEAVWRELVKLCSQDGSCCVNVEESDQGPVLCWRGSRGKLNRLTKKALSERLRKKNPE